MYFFFGSFFHFFLLISELWLNTQCHKKYNEENRKCKYFYFLQAPCFKSGLEFTFIVCLIIHFLVTSKNSHHDLIFLNLLKHAVEYETPNILTLHHITSEIDKWLAKFQIFFWWILLVFNASIPLYTLLSRALVEVDQSTLKEQIS